MDINISFFRVSQQQEKTSNTTSKIDVQERRQGIVDRDI